MSDEKSPVETAEARHLEAINASVAGTTHLKPLAETSCANPSLFHSGSFGIVAYKYEDDTIGIEVHEDSLHFGGRSCVKISELKDRSGAAISYEKFVKYCDEKGSRLMRVCWSDHGNNAVKIVIGKHGSDPTVFATIAAEIEIGQVEPMELNRLRINWDREMSRRRSQAEALKQMMGGFGGMSSRSGPKLRGLGGLASLLGAHISVRDASDDE